VLILLIWFIGQAFIIVPGVLLLNGEFTSDGQLSIPLPWGELLVSLASFLPFFIATPLIVRWLHNRPALSVVTPFRRVNVRVMLLGAAAWSVTLIGLTLVGLLVGGAETIRWNYQPDLFFPALAIAFTVLFIQTTAEELFFRGYLLQWFSKATRNVWVLSAASGLLFGLPHLANPEVAGASGAGYLVALVTYFATGFALAVVSIRSGTIELAIGAHFVNNFFNVVFLTVENSALGTPSLWVDSVSDINAAALASVLSAAVFIALTWRIRGSGDQRPFPEVSSLPLLPAAGWFPDPARQAAYRWWDGAQWTHHVG
jgi:membrane protease YdiL (CAAX protease family)